MDLERPQQVREFIRSVQPQLIVNTAAYTAVDHAESDPATTLRVNTEAPGILAEEAHRLSAALIHYSTDYVFDGTQTAPYDENDSPQPINVYGRSKQLGEHLISSRCQAYWIVRCSWIYSPHGRNFLRTFWQLAQEREHLNVVDDQIGAPTSARFIVAATSHMIGKAMQSPMALYDYIRQTSGIYHMTAGGQTSWHGMATHILQHMEQAGMPLKLTQKNLIAIASENFPISAQRPLNSRLNIEKLKRIFQLDIPEWRDELDACISELLQKSTRPVNRDN